MANRTTNRGHRAPKNGTRKTIKLGDRHCQIAAAIAPNTTAGIELGLELIEIAVDAAVAGDKKAIALLSKLGVQVETTPLEVIEVKRADGSIAAWIV